MKTRFGAVAIGLALTCTWTAPAFGECGECPGDLNADGSVDTGDLLELLAGWGLCIGCPADFDGNLVVNTSDLLTLLGSWGACGFQGFCASLTFDDGTATDDTGNGHDGVIVGSPASVPGVLGLALHLDGVDDHIVATSSPLIETNTVILSAWAQIDESPPADVTLLEKRAADRGYALRFRPDGHVAFEVWSPEGAVTAESEIRVQPGVWISVFASYDGNDARLWLYGTLEGAAFMPGLSPSSDGALVIGAADDGAASWFDGIVDEVRVGDGEITDQLVCTESLKLWAVACGECLDVLADVTEELNLGDTQHRHFGVCIADANNDGWVDLYYANGFDDPDIEIPPTGTCPDLTGGTPPFNPQSVGTFYLNQGDGTFTGDLAPEAGIDDYWNAMRHVWGDYDNDGFRDLISHNFVKSTLYHAIPDTDPPVFEDAGLELCLTKGTGASWVDVNNDGFLDLYACEYDPSRPAVDHLAVLYLNNQDGTFTDITDDAGINLPDNPMGIAFADFDNDGDQDVFITNSHEVATRLYRHDGLVGGIPQFTDIADEAGVALRNGETGAKGIGAGWGDYNNDGWLDLLFAREFDSRLWRNDGPTEGGGWSFTDVTDQNGLDMNGAGRFWGGNLVDIDNDGWLDIVMANRETNGAAVANCLYMNKGDGTWCEVADVLGVQRPELEQIGVAHGDLDNDGDLDVILTSHTLGQPNVVLRNQARGNNWVQFRLRGTVSNRDAVGARISVTAVLRPGDAPVTQIREIFGGTGFFSDIPRIQTFGLGKAMTIQSASIVWPSGIVQDIGTPVLNQRHDFIEPAAASVDLNNDGRVDASDLLMLLSSWGPCASCAADLTGDDVIDVDDLLLLFSSWG